MNGVDAVLYLVLAVAGVVGLWALIDAIVRPNRAFRASRQHKALWIVLLVVGLWLAFVPGGILGVVYLVNVRPKVRAAAL